MTNGPNLSGAYEVEGFKGKVERTKFTHKDGQMGTKVVEEDAGFMVYFPQGHSIRCKNEAELQRLGFTKVAEVIDLDSGDAVPGIAPQKGSVKEKVIKKTTNLKATPTVTDNDKGE